MKNLFGLLTMLLFTGCGCNKTKPSFTANSSVVIISEQLFNEAKTKSTHFKISDAEITGDMLRLKVGLTGAASVWEQRVRNLVSSGAVMESMPPQMALRLYISRHEDDMISSYFGNYEISFDLKPIRQKGYSQIALNLDGWSGPLMYEYQTETRN